MSEESVWRPKNRLGWVGLLGFIGFFVSFAGVAIYGFTTMMALSFVSWGGMGFDSMFSMFGMMDAWFANMAIKMFALFFGFFGLAQVNSNRPKLGGVLMVITGTLIALPVILGGTAALEMILQSFSVLPFIAITIGGALFIAAGMLAFGCAPSERPRHSISAAIDEEYHPPRTVCPNCRTPLLGDEKYCPGCGKTL
jgi:hypothetical protein